MFQLIARHLLHTLYIIVVESFTTPHHYCHMSVQPLPAFTVTKQVYLQHRSKPFFLRHTHFGYVDKVSQQPSRYVREMRVIRWRVKDGGR